MNAPNYDFFPADLKQQITDAHSRARGLHQLLLTYQKAGLPVEEHLAEVEAAMKLAQSFIRLWSRR